MPLATMTLLVSWIGVDSNGPASVYIAADSRISWTTNTVFDRGKKVFAFGTYPDVVGCCGDDLFPSMAISQLVELADNGLLFTREMTCQNRFEAFAENLKCHFSDYPKRDGMLAGNMFQIVYAARDRDNPRAFCTYTIEWRRSSGWKTVCIPTPDESAITACLGSGAKHFNKNYIDYQNGLNRSTSRNVFHCFCETLFSNVDPYCGGSPQLVGIYCKPNSAALNFGIVRDGKRYLYGMEIPDSPTYDQIQWRNDLFELCDGATMNRLADAQPQPDNLRTS